MRGRRFVGYTSFIVFLLTIVQSIGGSIAQAQTRLSAAVSATFIDTITKNPVPLSGTMTIDASTGDLVDAALTLDLQYSGQGGIYTTSPCSFSGGTNDSTRTLFILDSGNCLYFALGKNNFGVRVYINTPTPLTSPGVVPIKGASYFGNFGVGGNLTGGNNTITVTPISGQLSLTKNLGTPCLDACGNPINFAIGNKHQAETDYASASPWPLLLRRYYNSLDANGVRKFGAKWRGSYGRSVVAAANIATVTRDDGRALTFTLKNGVWTPDRDVNYRLNQSAAGWTLVTDQDEIETYDTAGHLLTYSNRGGQLTHTFSRDAQGRLVTATDPFGRTLTFAFVSSTSPLISRVTAPDGGVYSYAYDAQSNLTSVTYPDGSRRQYVYENANFPSNLTGIIDENGNRYATYVYNSNGLATSTQHAGGADLTTVDYTNATTTGEVRVTAPLGGVTSYFVQSVNGTAKQIQVSRHCSNCYYVGGDISNGYDANGNLTSTTDYNGNETIFTYDLTRNLPTSFTMAYGTSIARTNTLSWNPNYRVPAQIVDGTRSTTFSYDSKGNLLGATLTAPTLTSSWAFSYNSGGLLLTATDPRGNVTKYAYDARGNVTSATNALGQTTFFTGYDANGRLLSMTDPNGIATTFAYNFRGQLTTMTTLARVTSLAYDAVGNVTRITRPDGSFLVLSYDAAHRLIGVADTLGNSVAYTLDAAGNAITTQVLDPNHNQKQTHRQVFDGFSRLYQDIGASNQAWTFYYDNNDNLYNFSSPTLVQTTNTFDALNRIIQTTKSGSTVSLTYDAKGRINSVTDPRHLVTTYTYDGLNNITSVTSPDTGTKTNTYDGAGNLITATDGVGNLSTYTYDALNRITSWALSSGTRIAYGYDQGANGIGRLTSLSDPTGATTWAYNPFGQINLRQQTVGAVTLTTRAVYTDSTGLLASIAYPSGATASFSYNADGQPSVVNYQPGGGGTVSTLLSAITYQPFGPVASWKNKNGTTYSRSYDQDGRVAGIALPGGNTIALAYDPNSRITGISESGLATKGFSYDPLDRLTGYTAGTISQSFGYDAVGNRTSYSTNSPSNLSFNYQYPSTSNRLTSVSGSWTETYGYDANGNIVARQKPLATYQFAYNARNRQNAATAGSLTKTYQINAFGQRVAKLDGGVYQTLFSYDGSGHMMGRYNGDGSVLEETLWLGDLPAVVLAPGAQYAVAPDHQGSPHQITDGSKNEVWFWDHDPFGNGQPTGSFNYNLRFPGHFYDQSTGLFYNYYRDYDPSTGRYLESDPIGLAGGTNTYAYAGGNPVGNTDPLGLVLLQGSVTYNPNDTPLARAQLGAQQAYDEEEAAKYQAEAACWQQGVWAIPAIAFAPFALPVAIEGINTATIVPATRAVLAAGGLGRWIGAALGATGLLKAAQRTETFYRTMSQANYDRLMATGKVPATSETFISPSLEYAQRYNGVTVQFNVQAGTTDSLLGMGVRNAGLNGGAYGNLPLVQSGWGSSSAFFKLEGNVVNIGLGRGSALNTFNNNIVNFKAVPKP